MDSELPAPSSRETSLDNARGNLRESLGALRNFAQLLHSLRVAPKSLTTVLPDVIEALTPMRASADGWLNAVGTDARTRAAEASLRSFIFPRIDQLEEAMREAAARAMNAKSRLALEDIVSRCSFELDAARELLQLLEDAMFSRRVLLDPRELVREAFTSPPSARAEGRTLVSATLSSHDTGHEIEISPRVVMVLVALGVELVGSRPARETPHVVVGSASDGTSSVQVTRRAYATGEPLVLASRGVIEPTLPCLRAAATLTGGEVAWDAEGEAFTLTYFPGVDAVQGKAG